MDLAVVILAAGSGTRMKSKLPKVLHHVAGKPMVSHVVKEALKLKPSRLILVLAKESENFKEILGDDVEFVEQKEQLGTAHAVGQAQPLLKDFKGNVLILYGDTPLIQYQELEKLNEFHNKSKAAASVVTAKLDNPSGYGRIIRSDSKIVRIVEEKEASEKEKAIQEINSGMYVIDSRMLFEKIEKVQPDNNKKEYYLTDVIGILVDEGLDVGAFELGAEEVMGVNSRKELAAVSRLINQRIINEWLENGVTINDPQTVYIESDVQIEPDCVVQPHTFLKGNTKLGSDCEVGPFSQVIDSEIGDKSKITFSVIEKAKINSQSVIGPYSHIRPGTVVGENSKIGAFSEVKNSQIGARSKVPHLSYIGDAQIEEDVNIGAGSITCNYDGVKKEKTVIKKGAFIGSDTMFVAPVTIGENAVTGAGSVITDDVPANSLGLERSEQKNIADYAKRKKKKKTDSRQ